MSRRASSRRSSPGEKVEPDFEHFEESVGGGREVLDESIRHDYSTSDKGIVPLDRRRPLWHFVGIWTTFVAGFSFLFLGFQLHDGHSLPSVVGISVLGFAPLHRLCDVRRVPGLAYRPDAWAADPLDLRQGRIVGRLCVRPGRAAWLGRLPSRADGSDLGWPLRLGARLQADA